MSDALGSPYIETTGVRRIFADGDKRVEVLKGIDLRVRHGESLAILGPSGAGKSTFLHILGGLDAPSEGTIRYGGTEIFSLGEKARAEFRNREIGFVFQFHHLLPEFTALENVMMPGMIAGQRVAEVRERATSFLEDVGLAARLSTGRGLSGGEQQRVAVARALVMRPRCILADEPTGNLDTKTGAEVHDLLIRLNEEHGITLVIVTHNEALATQVSRRVTLVDGLISSDTGDDGATDARGAGSR